MNMKQKLLSGVLAALMAVNVFGMVSVNAAVVQQAKGTVGTFQVIPDKDLAAKKIETTVPVYGEGTYKVGTDLEAGEYLVLANKGTSCYFEVTKDSSGTAESILANDNVSTHSYITVKAGQYFTVKRGTFAATPNLALQKPTNNIYTEGMYRVGIDIPAGEYQVTAQGGSCYLEVSKDSAHLTEGIESNDNIKTNTYITVKNGQYLTVNRGQFSLKTPANKTTASATAPVSNAVKKQAVTAGTTPTAQSTGKSSVASNSSSTAKPATQKYEPVANKVEEGTATVYWGKTGNKIHTNPRCRSFKDTTPNSGTEAQAIQADRSGYCKIC